METNQKPRIKLNLEWVSNLVGEEYKQWRDGDVIIIESQTGTGKTHFMQNILIPNIISDAKRLLFVCNRINLKQQIKKDLLKAHDLEIPKSIDELDDITTVEGTTITSYQALEESILNHEYYENEIGTYDHSASYDYIVLDECHYILADSSFNNTTRLTFEKLIQTYHVHAVKIFMTATANEIEEPIRQYMKDRTLVIAGQPFIGEHRLKSYSTGLDYSYVNVMYFKCIRDIITTIQNDTSDDKWLVFVSNIEKEGKILATALVEDAVLITRGTGQNNLNNPELSSIVNHSKFTKKVLITTKYLDNGINIKDERVKNVVMA